MAEQEPNLYGSISLSQQHERPNAMEAAEGSSPPSPLSADMTFRFRQTINSTNTCVNFEVIEQFYLSYRQSVKHIGQKTAFAIKRLLQ